MSIFSGIVKPIKAITDEVCLFIEIWQWLRAIAKAKKTPGTCTFVPKDPSEYLRYREYAEKEIAARRLARRGRA